MSLAQVTEIWTSSQDSFDDAIAQGFRRAIQTLRGIRGAWVKEMKIDVDDGLISSYRVNLKVSFVLND